MQIHRGSRSIWPVICLSLAIVTVEAVSTSPVSAQVTREPVAMVRLSGASQGDLDRVARLGIDFRAGLQTRDAILFVTAGELQTLHSIGLTPEIIHPDAAVWFASRLDASLGPGSLGGYYTLAEAEAVMDQLTAAYPAIISEKFSIGTTIEGRSIWAFRISDSPSVADPNRPAVFYNGMTHAREPIGMMLLLGFAQDIARKYAGGDPDVDYLLSSRELLFVPIVNPDGYYYNEVNDPEGGGMWRKNKRDNNDDGTFEWNQDGVDLNRNFSFHWGEDDQGSSPDPAASTYRGPTPFSEPETQAVRDVVLGRSFQFILNYHAHSNVYLTPWGYTPIQVDRFEDFRAWASRLSGFNHYPYGTGTEMIGYHTNGDAIDWQYGSEGVLSMVPEVGTYFDNFWPPTSRISPLVEEHIGPNYLTAWMSGGVLLADGIDMDDSGGDGDGYAEPGETVLLNLTWMNAGISEPVTGAVATLEALGAGVAVAGATVDLGDYAPGESRQAMEGFTLQVGSMSPGRLAQFTLRVDADNGYTRTDTIGVLIGRPSVVFTEGWEEGADGWTMEGFELANSSDPLGTHLVTDAPGGVINQLENWLDLNSPFSLSGFDGAVLKFRSRPAIGARNLAMITIAPSPNPRPYVNPPDPLIYFTTGWRNEWEEVEIDLTPYAGTPRLWLGWYSNYWFGPGDGWEIDDIRIEAWTATGTEQPEPDPTDGNLLGAPYPNPSNPGTSDPIRIDVDLSQLPGTWSHLKITVYDTRGRLIDQIHEGSVENRIYRNYFHWDGYDMNQVRVPSGIYLIELRVGEFRVVRKAIILR